MEAWLGLEIVLDPGLGQGWGRGRERRTLFLSFPLSRKLLVEEKQELHRDVKVTHWRQD